MLYKSASAFLVIVASVFLFMMADGPAHYELIILEWCERFGSSCPAWVQEPAWGWLIVGLLLTAAIVLFWPFWIGLVRKTIPQIKGQSSHVSIGEAGIWLYNSLPDDRRRNLRDGASACDGGNIETYMRQIALLDAEQAGIQLYARWCDGGDIEAVEHGDVVDAPGDGWLFDRSKPQPIEVYIRRSDRGKLRKCHVE
ncbi:hypothetical protein [Hyphobacterium marinum]|uniref:Uncharacterized protein n=1 Tax=Hyphobacterium marinum TaxID=3116574 RepID=A0ABU7M290_9PROT|nr:hypothetical protein [Hyphobacterium sp. Y6023]MEE2567520.1 hypothetical protein [Hyphobacterium sp. Y6023]